MAEIDRLRQMRAANRRQAQDLIGGLRAATASLREEHRAYQREKAARDDERARARRDGDLGPELQRVQQRIDAGQTTWEDVVAGRDNSPDSQQIRNRIETNLNTLAEHLEEDVEFQQEGDRIRERSQRIDDELHGR